MRIKNVWSKLLLLMAGAYLLIPLAAFASEADLAIPDLHKGAPYTHAGWDKAVVSPLLWRVHHRRYTWVSAYFCATRSRSCEHMIPCLKSPKSFTRHAGPICYSKANSC